MIVNIDLEDRTWQIHLDGLLNILSQQSLHHRPSSMDNFGSLDLAIQICKSEGDVFRTLATCEMNSLGKAFLILDVAKLCLRPLTAKVEKVLKGATSRKIDVQKLRASIRQIQKNLKFFPKVCPMAEFDIDKVSSRDRLMNALLLVRWNDYHCLQLITADLLLTTGSFLYSCQGYEVTRESSILSGTIYEAAESICSAVPAILETEPIQMTDQSSESMKKPIRGLLVLWHLCCILKAPKLSQFQQDWIRETLWSIGNHAFIPQASALAISKGQNAEWTDVLAGLVLVRVALSKELLGLFSECGIVLQ
ncbi:hypothetical protein V1517DRAFT_26131 [Lipomyces orientalis]|uniref:Uncharacterized protein n=1 Tax=Lipomyces orientalis TaxID=1233043 RepID=A0ACC3TFC6_9ASCO